MHIHCWDELVRYGALDVLRREYGSLVQAQPESDYNVSLVIDLDTAPPEGGELLDMLGLSTLPTIMKSKETASSIPLHS
jgi:hypothetical protein